LKKKINLKTTPKTSFWKKKKEKKKKKKAGEPEAQRSCFIFTPDSEVLDSGDSWRHAVNPIRATFASQ
jgi:hypothetical protein